MKTSPKKFATVAFTKFYPYAAPKEIILTLQCAEGGPNLWRRMCLPNIKYSIKLFTKYEKSRDSRNLWRFGGTSNIKASRLLTKSFPCPKELLRNVTKLNQPQALSNLPQISLKQTSLYRYFPSH